MCAGDGWEWLSRRWWGWVLRCRFRLVCVGGRKVGRRNGGGVGCEKGRVRAGFVAGAGIVLLGFDQR